MRITIVLLVMLFFTGIKAQTTKTIVHNSLTRQYIEYVPSTYTGTESLPLIICLHGLGDNMTNFSSIGMHLLGETENFITLYPQAQNSSIGTLWNAGVSYMGMTLNATVQDVGFINLLIDTTSSLYNIDPSRIYICGFSMGGFMAQRLACESSYRIAAIASVAGTRATSLVCSPTNPVPVCHFHGTADQTIPYSANPYGIDTDTLIKYWVNFNECDINPTSENLPDVVADNITVEHFTYTNNGNGVTTELYKATGADHQWLYTPVNDMNYTVAIWEFFNKHQLQPASINQSVIQKKTNSSPNPASEYINIESIEKEKGIVKIVDLRGNIISSYTKEANVKTIPTSKLKPGIYNIRFTPLDTKKETTVTKFVKQ